LTPELVYKEEYMRDKWYHASPKRLRVGTVLTGVFVPSGPWEAKGKVFITAGETPHYTIIDRAVTENWHIYQVMPLEKKIFWGSHVDEAMCLSAQIVRYVGTARGIISQRIRDIPQKTKREITKNVSDPSKIMQSYVSSRVTWRQVVQWNHSRKNRNE
jgi:hypothetical protein